MIEQYSFGRMAISGITYSSDLKIIQGQVVPKWWRGAGHLVQLADVANIIQSSPDFLVLGTGIGGGMKVSRDVEQELERVGIELIKQPTAEAMQTYNRLVAEGKDVAAGFHLTC